MEPRYVVRPTDTERVVAIGSDGARHFIPMPLGAGPLLVKGHQNRPFDV
jgi:hypothetical protein